MTLKYSPICDDPKKYPQNLHTPKNIHFSEAPKTTEIQNFEPQKLARAYLCMKIPEPPPPPPPTFPWGWSAPFRTTKAQTMQQCQIFSRPGQHENWVSPIMCDFTYCHKSCFPSFNFLILQFWQICTHCLFHIVQRQGRHATNAKTDKRTG